MRRSSGILLAGLIALPVTRAEPAAPVSSPPAFNLVTSVQYAHEDIYHHTPAGITPVLANTREIAPGQRLDLLVVVTRYAVDGEGRADVSYDFAVHYPDGRTQALAGNAVAAKLKVRPATFLYPQVIRAFVTGPRDPFGTYRFDVTVHDHVSGQESKQSRQVQVADSNRPLPLPDNFDASDWLSTYYQRPEPRFALPALEALSHNPAVVGHGPEGLGMTLGFYAQVLADNPWVVPWFKQWLVAADGDQRHLLAEVLAYAERGQPGLNADLPPRVRGELAAAGREALPFPAAHPVSAGQLDALWGQFFASGKFQPVAELVAVVGASLPRRGQPREATPPTDAIKDAVLNSTLWSLRVNAFQYKVVHDYLLYLQEAPDTPLALKASLAAVLSWKPGKL
jgi:hypothetical protein